MTAWQRSSGAGEQATLSYGGSAACLDDVGQKLIDVVPQVSKLSHGRTLWFTIGGAGLFQGPTPIGPLRLQAERAAVGGHRYRVLVYAKVVLSGGTVADATVCSICRGAQPTLSIAWAKDSTDTFPPVSATLPGVDCTVTTFEMTYAWVNETPIVNYGGELLCDSSVAGIKRLTIATQVAAPGGHSPTVYDTVAGSELNAGPAVGGYLSLQTNRTVFTGHTYRVVVTGSVSIAGHTYSVSAHTVSAGP